MGVTVPARGSDCGGESLAQDIAGIRIGLYDQSNLDGTFRPQQGGIKEEEHLRFSTVSERRGGEKYWIYYPFLPIERLDLKGGGLHQRRCSVRGFDK